MEDIEQPIVETVIEEIPAAPIEPEKEYRYQPKDEAGRKLGGEQVIKYRTTDELIQKMADQNIHLVRKLRETTSKLRLGVSDPDNIPDEAPKFDTPLVFTPRQLTPDERVQLSRDLLDPEKSEEATNTMFEAAMGAKPSLLMSEFNRLSSNSMKLTAKIESDAFMQSNPEYYACRENFDAITGWMVKNDLAPVRQNFQLAYDTLRRLEGGVIVDRPEPVASVVPVETVIEEPVVTREELPVEPVVPVAPRKAPPASGLRGSGEVVVPPIPAKYTLAMINKMSGEEYKKRLLHEKGFAAIIEKLEQEAASKSRR